MREMFVFPLGLEAKTRDFPWATLAILAATVVYSVLHMDVTDWVTASRLNDPLSLERFHKQKALAVAACPRTEQEGVDLKTGDCRFLSDHASLKTSENSFQFYLRLANAGTETRAERARLRRLRGYVGDPSDWRRVSPETASLLEYGEFSSALAEEEEAFVASAREHKVLTRGSFDLESLMRAQFLHAGWWHLIGNMLFFLLFAIPLEQRLGSLALSLIYFLGGACGITLHLYLSPDVARTLMGASAGVSAVAAAFMVAFWSFSIRLWVSVLFTLNQIVFVPCWVFFAGFFVLQDVSGALEVKSDGVAHLAHLGGFGMGALFALIFVQLKSLPASFVFPFESDLIAAAKAAGGDLDRRLGLLREVLFHNPRNATALVESWHSVRESQAETWEELPLGARVFLNERFCDLLKRSDSTDKENTDFREILARAKSCRWPAAKLVPAREMRAMTVMIGGLESRGRLQDALDLLGLVLAAGPAPAHAQLLKRAEAKIASKLKGAIPAA